MSLFRSFITLSALALLAACATSPDRPDGAPRSLKIGKPYTINGQTYYPHYDPHYDEEGIASWYGPGFHGKKTANGETYDMHGLTAAHKTLPMPSLVRVTNQATGKSVVVKITDRGPFAAGRIIDLSKGAADALDVKGIEKVRVQYLKEETEQLWADMDITPKEIKFARNDKSAPSKSEIMEAQTEYDRAQQEAFYDSSNVSEAAPIMSVSSNDVGGVASSKTTGTLGLISNAEAATTEKPLPPLAPVNLGRNSNMSERDEDEALAANVLEDEAQAGIEAPENQRVVESERISTYPSNANAHTLTNPQPKSLDPPPATAGYMVQAGAFSSAVNATSVATRVKHLGKPMIDVVSRPGGNLHRVRVGPFASKSEAQGVLHELFKLGIKDASVVSSK